MLRKASHSVLNDVVPIDREQCQVVQEREIRVVGVNVVIASLQDKTAEVARKWSKH